MCVFLCVYVGMYIWMYVGFWPIGRIPRSSSYSSSSSGDRTCPSLIGMMRIVCGRTVGLASGRPYPDCRRFIRRRRRMMRSAWIDPSVVQNYYPATFLEEDEEGRGRRKKQQKRFSRAKQRYYVVLFGRFYPPEDASCLHLQPSCYEWPRPLTWQTDWNPTQNGWRIRWARRPSWINIG